MARNWSCVVVKQLWVAIAHRHNRLQITARPSIAFFACATRRELPDATALMLFDRERGASRSLQGLETM